MGAPTRAVLHRGPKPISLNEFRDAVEAVCPPRFPPVPYARPRRITLAVSGGVDSMAMAFLFSKLLKTHRGIMLAENPAEGAFGIIVDHRLRRGSTVEASRVAQELRGLGIRPVIRRLRWTAPATGAMDPAQLPNLEGVARTMRYRMLGSACRSLQTSSLFFAHHRDDQYETVLMRLLAGHGYRGLQGIREANAIPECYGFHGVHKSGMLDYQLNLALKDDFKGEPGDQTTKHLGTNGMSADFARHAMRDVDTHVLYQTRLNCEDGGVIVYH